MGWLAAARGRRSRRWRTRSPRPGSKGGGGRSFTLTDLAGATGLPTSQVATALAFLKERGYVNDGPRRRNVANPAFGHDDAMCEYHALYEEPAADASPPAPPPNP